MAQGNLSNVSDDNDDGSEDQTENEEPAEQQYFGTMANRLVAWAKAKKDTSKEGPDLYENLATYMNDQLAAGFHAADLDFSIKEYPPLKNVPLAWAPELERELFEQPKFTRDSNLKATEVALKSIQRGVASAINALGPLAEVVMRQCEDNEELDAASTPMLDVIKLLSNALAGLTKKRRDLLKPILDAKYQKLGRGDEDFDPKFLFGGNLAERARKLKANNILMKEILKDDKPSPSNHPQRRHQPYGGGSQRSGGQGSGYRQGFKQNSGSGRGRGRSSGGNNNGQNNPHSNNGKKDFWKQGSSSNNSGKRS